MTWDPGHAIMELVTGKEQPEFVTQIVRTRRNRAEYRTTG